MINISDDPKNCKYIIHFLEKIFKCEICYKSFGNSQSLIIHQKAVHLQEKNFQCDLWNNKFGQSSHLDSLEESPWNLHETCMNLFICMRRNSNVKNAAKALDRSITWKFTYRQYFFKRRSSNVTFATYVLGIYMSWTITTYVRKIICEMCGKWFEDYGLGDHANFAQFLGLWNCCNSLVRKFCGSDVLLLEPSAKPKTPKPFKTNKSVWPNILPTGTKRMYLTAHDSFDRLFVPLYLCKNDVIPRTIWLRNFNLKWQEQR